MSDVCVNGITKDTPLIRTTGGKRVVHAIGCPIIKDWEMTGCVPLDEAKPKTMKFCPKCEKMIWTSIGALDYMKHRMEYHALYRKFNVSTYRVQLLYNKGRAKTELRGNVLYARSKGQRWKIDFSDPDQLILWHNNYTDKGNDVISYQGYHEHEVSGSNPGAQMANCINQISQYEYEKAKEIHKKNKKRVLFSELDPEYYGFD